MISLHKSRSQNDPGSSDRKGRAAIVALLATGVVLAALFVRGRGAAPEEPKVLTLEERYRADSRIAHLVDECAWPGAFEVDTTDVVKILTTKLDASAQREPQRRAMAALARLGEEAEEPMTRLFEDALRDRMRVAVAKNVLSVCANSTSDFGRKLAFTGLSSPHENVRRESVIVLMRHPRPENFDPIQAVFPGLIGHGIMEHTLQALLLSDQDRFVDLVQKILEENRPLPGERSSSPLVDGVTSRVYAIEDADLAARLATIARAENWLPYRNRVSLLGPAARYGDEAALQELRDGLASDKPRLRGRAAESLARCKLSHELYVLAATTDNAAERANAWELILDPEHRIELSEASEAELYQWARRALGDSAFEVRNAVLGPLLKVGDEEARAHLIRKLNGTAFDRAGAAPLMRDTFEGHPDFADRVRDVLIKTWQDELAAGASTVELRSVLTALGAVPGDATGRFLLERAREIHALNQELLQNETKAAIEPRHALAQAFNAGPASRDVLLEALSTETDPFLRLDLVYFAWQDFEDDSFEVLAGILQNDSLSPYERVFTADRMLRMKLPERLLPIMKRVYRSTQDPVLRDGLECLLWVWFGPPTEQ